MRRLLRFGGWIPLKKRKERNSNQAPDPEPTVTNAGSETLNEPRSLRWPR
jgi:hypothetical protein